VRQAAGCVSTCSQCTPERAAASGQEQEQEQEPGQAREPEPELAPGQEQAREPEQGQEQAPEQGQEQEQEQAPGQEQQRSVSVLRQRQAPTRLASPQPEQPVGDRRLVGQRIQRAPTGRCREQPPRAFHPRLRGEARSGQPT
jgi:hypothetical protein